MLTIATLAEIKAELGIKDVQDNAELTRLAEGLQGRFDGYCRRTLARADSVVELHDGGVTAIELKRFPVETVASVHVSRYQAWTDAYLWSTDDYRVNLERGLIFLLSGGKWEEGIQNIRVVYTGGYATGAYPEELRRAFFLQFGFEWRNRLHLGQQSVSAQGMSVTVAPAKLLADVTEILNAYVRL